MAGHNVSFTIPWRDLGTSDVEFEVKKDGEALGKLEVSKGSVVWFPKGAKKGHKMSWGKFSRTMVKHGTKGPETR